METIENCYGIPFKNRPSQSEEENKVSARNHVKFLQQAIREMVKQGKKKLEKTENESVKKASARVST
jgi:hypothetical protein